MATEVTLEKKTMRIGSEGDGWNTLAKELFRIAFPDYQCVMDNQQYQVIMRGHYIDAVQPELPLPMPYMTWCNESFAGRRKGYPPVLDFRSHGKTDFALGNINVPFLVLVWINYYKSHQKQWPRLGARPYFLAYCNSNPIREREYFFRLARERVGDRAHGWGSCSNTTHQKHPDGFINPSLIETYHQYTFVMAMENTQKEGYITEKLLNALLSGSIPIYWGDERLAKSIFNAKAFICIADYASFEACMDDLIAIEKDPIRLTTMQSEPIFCSDTLPALLRICEEDPGQYYKDIGKKLREILLPIVDPDAEQVERLTHVVDLALL